MSANNLNFVTFLKRVINNQYHFISYSINLSSVIVQGLQWKYKYGLSSTLYQHDSVISWYCFIKWWVRMERLLKSGSIGSQRLLTFLVNLLIRDAKWLQTDMKLTTKGHIVSTVTSKMAIKWLYTTAKTCKLTTKDIRWWEMYKKQPHRDVNRPQQKHKRTRKWHRSTRKNKQNNNEDIK